MGQIAHREKLISGLGGFISIAAVFGVTRFLETELHAQLLLIASMGASAVLLFAVPRSPLAQPWNVLGGHMVSALVGVAVLRVVPDPVLGGGLAVGLAITAMHYLNCLHPPGGATSAIPLLAGPAAMQDYSWAFVLFPIGLGAGLMTLIAIAYNWPFAWRRYPARLAPPEAEQTAPPSPYPDITHADFVAALSQIDTFMDISDDDLLRIYHLAMKNAGCGGGSRPGGGQP